jgi:hypothetical protein
MAKITYDTLPPDALVDIKISGTFYRKMVDLLTMLSESVTLEEFRTVLQRMKENNPAEDLFELNVHTLMSLIYEVEVQAKAQNKCTKAEVEVPDEPSDSSPQQDPQSPQ